MSVTKFRNDSRPASAVRGYKGFNADMTCRGFQYEVGGVYEMDGPVIPNKQGFHFCRTMKLVFWYYNKAGCRYAEIEALGDVSEKNGKCVTNKIRIVREIPQKEAIKLSISGEWNTGTNNAGNYNTGCYNTSNWNIGDQNTGSYNSGDCNTGDRNDGAGNTGNCNAGSHNAGFGNAGNNNAGDHNIGHHNAGHHNAGNYNSGSWNIADCSAGFFNTISQPIFMFNKPCEWTREEFESSDAGHILSAMPASYTDTEWIPVHHMTDKEKESHPEYQVTGGYLKIEDRKANRQAWWDGLDDTSKAAVLALPNFDAEIFKKCTGIKV